MFCSTELSIALQPTSIYFCDDDAYFDVRARLNADFHCREQHLVITPKILQWTWGNHDMPEIGLVYRCDSYILDILETKKKILKDSNINYYLSNMKSKVLDFQPR